MGGHAGGTRFGGQPRRRGNMSTAALASRIREAAGSAIPQRIVAGGSWLRAGAPVKATQTLSVAAERGIEEYVPGDLTLTARAGTPITDLVAAVKAHEQWLPLDPWGGDGGSVGATISTATAGPHSHAMGSPRDVTLGMEFVTGTGETVRSGGRVVKNVAGFDLTRLLIGSWGTLGVITEVTLRLRARPAMLRSFAVPLDGADVATGVAAQLRSLPFTPLAAELVDAALARMLGAGDTTTLLLRLGGNARSVEAQIGAIRALQWPGGRRPGDAPPDVWRRLRESDRDAQASWRRSQLPSAFGETWSRTERAARAHAKVWMHGAPLRGVVRVLAGGDDQAIARAARDGPGTLIPEVAPPGVEAMASPARQRIATLERRIRSTFDPEGILNPGILGAHA